MYRLRTAIVDIAFIFSLFACNLQLFMSIKQPLVTLSCIFIPLVMSTLMVRMWVQDGIANANFLFFQILLMWSGIATYIVMYTKCALVAQETAHEIS